MSTSKTNAFAPDLGGTKALFAEMMGTALLTLAAAGAATSSGPVGGLMGGGGDGAWAAGLTLVVLVLVFGPVSGAHFNPAVSVGLTLNGRLAKSKLLPYVVAQLIGAVIAAAILRAISGTTLIGQTTSAMPAMFGLAPLVLEAVLTFWLVWVILAVTEKDVPLLATALAIGLTISAAGHWAGHLSGASLNPARSFGPALVSMDFSQLWIYLIGPTVGGAAAGLAYNGYKGLR